MQLKALTPLQQQLVKLPIVLSARTWQEAVYTEHPFDWMEFEQRLTEVIRASYLAILQRPEVTVLCSYTYDFGLYRLPPKHQQDEFHWLDLRLIVEREQDVPTQLRIMLRNENSQSTGRTRGMLFEPGLMLMTRGIDQLKEQGLLDIAPYLGRHLAGDWGELDEEDKLSNNQALHNGTRLFSAYDINAGDHRRLYIITEADRSATTLLLPYEY
ncbi:hypothetical protein [Pseudomonas sp. MWU13-2105]|uniref:hypothetical protein n=1 Tax=Pseudomonas sp. MWU13-2105 TaxID=2935074 RepID=UPI002010A0A7|nr:hypothetical protein [Pseudomonas sp. MWU13-2105]